MSLIEDAQSSRLAGIKFHVTRKSARGARWQTVETGIEDLVQAIQIAEAIDDYESGIFLDYPPERAGFLYWSSRYPEQFHSNVLTVEIH